MIQLAATMYVVVVGGVILFQYCLIAGAPWGRFMQGGRFEGVLPISGRVAAGLSVPLLVCMGAGVSSAAGMTPHWPKWAVSAFQSVQVASTIHNWITSSRAERLLWGPITTVMLVLAAYVIRGRQHA